MAKQINYKNLLNGFVDTSNAYTSDVNNRLKSLYFYYNMGCVEEYLHNRRFNSGSVGNSGNTKPFVGIPSQIFQTITTYYENLKSNISGETTDIQTKFNSVTPTPTNEEKTYIKNILNQYLEEALSNITSEIISITNSFRDLQIKTTKNIDKLNFITGQAYDGQFLNNFGGRVIALQLTSSTTTLTNNYYESCRNLLEFIGDNIENKFIKNYPTGNEYFFFTHKVYTNDVLTFNFGEGLRKQLLVLLQYRDSELYDDLLKVDETGVNGIKAYTKYRFKPLLDNIIIPWIKYDAGLQDSRFTNGLEIGHETYLGKSINYQNSYNVGYNLNTGFTADNLVRTELRNRNIGLDNELLNYKSISQLYIS